MMRNINRKLTLVRNHIRALEDELERFEKKRDPDALLSAINQVLNLQSLSKLLLVDLQNIK